jgi:threonine/homoserine/homoserine lactone efflux protein
MMYGIWTFLLQVVLISLSGVMGPGPVTAATLAAGTRRPHAGAWIAVGHGIVEFPLMGLIMAGAGTILKTQGFQIGVGLAGGAMLIVMGVMLLRGIWRKGDDTHSDPKATNPLWTGIVLTGGNPYFLLWWATVGLALATQAASLGVLAFGLFAIVHWVCDLIWLEVLSIGSHKGATIFGLKSQRMIGAVSAIAMVGFGVFFVADAVRSMG